MPLTGPDSYLPTTGEFLGHWAQVNAALGGTAATDLRLTGSYLLANLTTDRQALVTANDAIEAARNALGNAYGTRDLAKSPLRARLAQFRAAVRFTHAATGYARSLPRLPSATAGEADFLRPHADAAHLWGQINADATVPGFTPPMTLVGGYALAAFNADLTALRARFQAANAAVADLRLAYDRRDALLPPLKARLLEYRRAVLARFGAGHPLVTGLPRVTPAPGPPALPVLSPAAVWDAQADNALLTWSLPAQPDAVARVEVRHSPGASYDAKQEQVILSLAPTATSARTSVGLPAEGSLALYKIYVVLASGRERGGKALKVIRGA